MRFKIFRSKRQSQPIAGTLGKIGNAEIGYIGFIAASHDLIIGSLVLGLSIIVLFVALMIWAGNTQISHSFHLFTTKCYGINY